MKEAVVAFEITAPSAASAGETAQKLEAAVSAYFSNRGFLLPGGQDESWAAYWAAYFLEMGLQTGALKWETDVKAVLLETAGGKVRVTELKHWPLK